MGAAPTQRQQIQAADQEAAVDAGVARAERQIHAPHLDVMDLCADAVDNRVHLAVEGDARPGDQAQ